MSALVRYYVCSPGTKGLLTEFGLEMHIDCERTLVLIWLKSSLAPRGPSTSSVALFHLAVQVDDSSFAPTCHKHSHSRTARPFIKLTLSLPRSPALPSTVPLAFTPSPRTRAG
jgi:hypothetical protein